MSPARPPKTPELRRKPKDGKTRPARPADQATRRVNSISATGELPFPVVGVGASAGGLAAVTDLLKHLPRDLRVAVVVVQHLDPKHGSLTPDILSRVSPMPVAEVVDGMRIQAHHVYVIPPNATLRVSNGDLKLLPREAKGQHLPIDLFFRSLAEEKKEQAIGVVMSGIASDGTAGVQAIKSEGGFTFAQDPVTAQYDGMPRSAIQSGAVDVVETPDKIAGEIAKIAESLARRGGATGPVESTVPSSGYNGNLRRIFALIRNATGADFTHYKQSTIQRRISRRLFLAKIDDLQTYAEYLGRHPDEVQALFSDILIHVTGFFRDAEAYESLKTKILPKHLEHWNTSVPFRVWVPGCSSGEEAYSIAMVFFEVLDSLKVRPSLQIFASDISEAAIQRARAAVYPDTVVKDVSKARLNRFFERVDGGGYRIAKWLRDTCLFSSHDLTADPPFARIDLISCRNVLIYFTSDLQKRVVPILHYALNPNGILWLGRSETISGFNNLFALQDRAGKFYSKKVTATPVKVPFPVTRHLGAVSAGRKVSTLDTSPHVVEAEADRVALEQYTPPGVVINDTGEILQVRGRPAPYLELASGQATLNIFKLAHPDIVSDLRYLVSAAHKRTNPMRKDGLTIEKNGTRHTLGIRIVPLHLSPEFTERYYSIFFEAAPGLAESKGAPVKPRETGSMRKQRLAEQRRVEDDRRYQQELIDEYETTQEELVSSNEELQSTNEELQSTNEELETAKEELQSANEEMTTINDELQARNTEMTQVTNDLTNLLASVNLAIVMVGPDTRIRRFTPKAGETLNLIPTDVGRPIGDIKPAVQAPDLDVIVADVMKTLAIKEEEAQDGQGTWYRLQVRPYRTADNRIDGAVLALADISDLKRAGAVLKTAADDARAIVEAMPTAMLVLTSDRRVQIANRAFYSLFQMEPSEVEGKYLLELSNGRWNIPSFTAALDEVFEQATPFHDFEVEHDFPRVGHKSVMLHATATRLASSGLNVALLAFEDLTARKRTAALLQSAEARYQHLLENANDGIVIVDQDGVIEFVNRHFEAMFGYAAGELKNQPYQQLIPERYRDAHENFHADFMRPPGARDTGRETDLYGQRKDGSIFPLEISLSRVRDDSATLVTAIVRDISTRKKDEVERQDLLSRETAARHEAERANQVKDEFLATLSHELRTPLSTILAWVQVLRLGTDAAKTREAIASIERSVKAQTQLIEDLLDISRIRVGKLNLAFQEIEPAHCITASIDSIRAQAEANSLTIETDLDSSRCSISADPIRIEQVLRNLLSNAIKFTPPGGKVTVRSRVKTDPERIEIQVQDTGKGIKPEFLPNLFTRFSQEDSSIRREAGGLGLGLSIVKNLVEMHNGSVLAESLGAGQGAVFSITLPCSAPRPAGSGAESATVSTNTARDDAPKLTGIRVLIIDDVADARDALSAILESLGARAQAVESAAEGLNALGSFKPDVVLCDIGLPVEDGFSFIRRLRALAPREGGTTPTAALSAYAGAEHTERSLEAGFDLHVAKPVDAVDLSRAVVQLASRRVR
jgi:two-component system, chemotaxis family, CheB/CheR fusion protein